MMAVVNIYLVLDVQLKMHATTTLMQLKTMGLVLKMTSVESAEEMGFLKENVIVMETS